MCGIAGIFAGQERSRYIQERYLERLAASLAHRGPNDCGIWHDVGRGIGFAHRRLSIVDLSSEGHQPMVTRDGRYAITFNGEIYNHAFLRRQLEDLGYQYHSKTDTETLLTAYAEWGEQCLDKLDGMFAFAVFDRDRQELFIARDRIGIKPLYFATHCGLFAFASEIKAFWKLPWVEKQLNTFGLYHTLTFRTPPAPLTFYEGIYKLPAGYYAKINASLESSFHQWYDIASVYSRPCVQSSEESYIEQTRYLLRAAVKKRMMGDVPSGVFLSGGLDSSLNVALMAERVSKVTTFNVAIEGHDDGDERMWAQAVAKRFDTNHHEIVISEKQVFSFFRDMVYCQDEPLADWVSLPLHFVAMEARDAGVAVVLVGEGADELFCGYDVYARYLRFATSWWNPSVRYTPQLLRQLLYRVARVFPFKDRYKEHMKNWANSRGLFWGGAVAFGELQKERLIANLQEKGAGDEVVRKIYPELALTFDSYAFIEYYLSGITSGLSSDFLASIAYLELKNRLPELLLMRLDKMTMAASVEGRVPFLDHHVAEFALRLPAAMKYRDGQTKYVLKQAARGILPDDVIDRKKVGFGAPVTRWFRDGLYFSPYFKALLRQGKRCESSMLNFSYMNALYQKHLTNDYDYAPELWTLQSVMTSLPKYVVGSRK